MFFPPFVSYPVYWKRFDDVLVYTILHLSCFLQWRMKIDKIIIMTIKTNDKLNKFLPNAIFMRVDLLISYYPGIILIITNNAIHIVTVISLIKSIISNIYCYITNNGGMNNILERERYIIYTNKTATVLLVNVIG